MILIFIQIDKECRKYETDEGFGEQRNIGKRLKLDRNMSHIPSELKAKHIGEMLALLPSSVFGTRGIYGFLVQGTKVNIEEVCFYRFYNICIIKCSNFRYFGGV